MPLFASATQTRANQQASECRTWSHAVISFVGGEPEWGWSGAGVTGCTLSDLDWVRHLDYFIAMGFDNGTVTFRIDHTPLHRIDVQS